jgi:5-methylthioadenosine/S-adenosylhomocysteine deaminase
MVDRLIWPLSQTVDDELFEALFRVAFAEQARAGIGTIGEFHYLHNGEYDDAKSSNFASRIIQIAIEMGLRLNLVYTFFDQGSSDRAKAFIRPLDVSLEEFRDLREKYGDHPLIHIAPGIHSLEHTSSEAIIAAFELAEEHNTRLHVQLAEREDELESARTQYGTTPLRALQKVGVLNQRLVIANGTLLEKEELDLVKENGASVVLTPTAILARSEELGRYWRVAQSSIPFAFGSGSLAMNHNYAIPEDIKWVELSLRAMKKSAHALCGLEHISTLWDLGARAPAQVLDLSTAQLMPGCPADFALIRPHQPLDPPENRSGGHLINQIVMGWGVHADLSHLLVQGRVVVRGGRTEIDQREAYTKLNHWNDAFLRSIKKATERKSAESRSAGK